jgi:hypothetical protein
MGKSIANVVTESFQKPITMTLTANRYEADEGKEYVILIFQNEEGHFLDARLVETNLSRIGFNVLIDEFVNYSVEGAYCEFCNDKLNCGTCKNYEFNIEEFLIYAQNFGETYEIDNSGIMVYNNLTVNTTKEGE